MKAVLALVFLAIVAFGAQKNASYSVEYGLFKELGTAEAAMKDDGKSFTIDIYAKTQGVAKFLTRNRVEHYSSVGYKEGEQFVPTRFVQSRKWSDREDRTTYTFDHKTKKITKLKEKFEDGKLEDRSEEPLEYYAKNDILTLYFNIAENLKTFKAGDHKIYYAVGANPKDGKVDVISPSGAKLNELKEYIGGTPSDKHLIVIINQKIFQSENGELFLLFDSTGETKKAVLKDVILFGDIRGIKK
jgi:Protein of unknown function (DUF3108)